MAVTISGAASLSIQQLNQVSNYLIHLWHFKKPCERAFFWGE
jgi:hypothetical protein